MKKRCAFAAFLSLIALPALAENPLVVVTSDFQTGSVALLDPGTGTARADLLTIHSDAVVRYHGGRIYVINRLGQDNVLVLDPANPATPLLQFSAGNGSNPQDLEFASEGKAYVSRNNSAALLVVDPRTGESLREIDLSGFADADGLPEQAEMALVGNRLYVACQRLDRDAGWVATESVLVAVDTATDEVVDWDPAQDGVQALRLQSVNPGNLVALGTRLYVAQTGQYGVNDGGVEVVDLDSGRSLGLVLGEAALQGDLTALALVSPDRGYGVVSAADFSNSVRPLDLSSGTAGAPLPGHSGGYTPDIEVDGDHLIVADRGTFSDPAGAGLLIYDAATGAFLSGPIGVGLPPAGIAVLGDNQLTAVEEESATLPNQTALGAAYPNPFNGGIHIPLTLGEGTAPVSLEVYDALGHRVRSLVARGVHTGARTVAWDGRDDQGRSVGSGTYLVELRVGTRRQSAKLLLLK